MIKIGFKLKINFFYCFSFFSCPARAWTEKTKAPSAAASPSSCRGRCCGCPPCSSRPPPPPSSPPRPCPCRSRPPCGRCCCGCCRATPPPWRSSARLPRDECLGLVQLHSAHLYASASPADGSGRIPPGDRWAAAGGRSSRTPPSHGVRRSTAACDGLPPSGSSGACVNGAT